MRIEVGKTEKGFLSAYSIHTLVVLERTTSLLGKLLEEVRYQLHSAWYI